MTPRINRSNARCPTKQQGVTTLAITLILLIIITLMVIFSTNVGFFEQKTATNENRARISLQAAEYAINLGGEYLKAKRDNLISNTAGSGWLATTGTSRRWAKCADVGTYPANHPCLSEPDLTRRAQLYFYTSDGTTSGNQALPYTDIVPSAAQVESGMGGASAFTAAATVRALLCRLDTSNPASVACKLNPVSGNRVALTLISDATLSDENGAKGAVKETWASYSTFMPSASVPLVASGLVTGLGNGQIVANPDSRFDGSMVMASIWSPNHVDRGGSYITCQLAEFTNQLVDTGSISLPASTIPNTTTTYPGKVIPEMTMLDVKQYCAGIKSNSPPCSCPKAPNVNRTSADGYSGHCTGQKSVCGGTGGGGNFHTGNDVLDVAAGEPVCDSTTNDIASNCRTLPSITFFPGPNNAGTPMDHAGVLTDDSIFEYIFGVDYVVPDRSTNSWSLSNCGTSGTQSCVEYAMIDEFGAQPEPDCSNLGTGSSGIIYVRGPCSKLAKKTIGSPSNPAIVVINQGNASLDLGQDFVMYGLLFVHADKNNADVSGQNPQVFGGLVVEGSIKMTGQFTIVYDDTSAASDINKIPKSAKFGLVPGSWLDAKTSF
jgi:hypothetical protein